MSNWSTEQVVYVASGVGAVLVLTVDPVTGRLSRRSETQAGQCPSFLAFHPELPLAYAVDEDAAVVRSFAIGVGGALQQIGSVDSGGAGPAYISIDRAGKHAFVANYGGGTVAVLAISETGALRSPTQVVEAGKHPHAIAADVENRRVSVPVLGEDAVLQYAFDPARGLLEPALVPRTNAPAGAGPRHIDFHPTLPVAYVVHEHSSELTAYAVAADGFTQLVTCSTLPGGLPFAGNTGSDVHVAPSGRFVYASNRGHDSIAVFELDARGLPSPTAHAATLGSTPRNFCLLGDGALLLVANLRSDSVTTFAVDAATGALSPLATTKGIERPFWIGAPPPVAALRARRAA
jgi:6-phosphogluconolactonase